MGSQRSAQLISLDDVLLIEGQPGIPQTARAEVIILRDLVTSGLPPSALQSLRQPPPKHTLPGWGRCGLLSPFLAFDNAAAGRILWLVDSQSFTPFTTFGTSGTRLWSNWFREFSKKEVFGNSDQRSFSRSFAVLIYCCTGIFFGLLFLNFD